MSTLAEDGTERGSASSSSSTFGNAAAKQRDVEPRGTPSMASKARGVAAGHADAEMDVAHNDLFSKGSSSKDDGSSDKDKHDSPNSGVQRRSHERYLPSTCDLRIFFVCAFVGRVWHT